MNYFTSAVNESKTREFPATDSLTGGIFTAVELTGDGVVTAGASSIPLGILLEDPADDETVTIQIDGGGLWLAGESLTAGDLLAAGDSGVAVKATSGKFIFAQALEDVPANTAGQVQIIRGGKA